MGLEDEYVEVVVRHDRAPVGLGVLPVETLPDLQARDKRQRYVSGAHTHTQRRLRLTLRTMNSDVSIS